MEEGSCSWVGEGDVEDTRAGGGVEWEPGEDTRDIEERKAQVRGLIKVGGRNRDVLRGEFSKWVWEGVMEVEVPHGDSREGM